MDVGSPSHRETKWLRDRLRLSLRKLQPPTSDDASLLATAMVLRAFHSRLSRASMVKSCRRARGLNPFTLNHQEWGRGCGGSVALGAGDVPALEEQQGCGRNYGDVRQHYQKAVKITRQIANQRECHRIAPSASGCSGVSHPTRDGARQNEVVDHAEPVEQGKQQRGRYQFHHKMVGQGNRDSEVLQRKIAHLLTRPTEGPSPKPIVSYHDFTYQAQSWNVSRRVVAKVEWHQGELFPRVGFIVANLSYPTIGIVRFYNGRGTAEQWIKEGKHALNWTRLSCHKFVANQVRLGLFIMAYNLGNFLRRLVLPESMKHWSLTSLQTRMIKTGGRLVRHARRLVFQLAEVLVSREMLCGILERIGRLRLAPG